jgi:hypothetical protein
MRICAILFLIPSLLLASPASDARQAARREMAAYKQGHPNCEWCGVAANPAKLRWIEVHHVIPVSVAPERAADTNNMVSLCRRDHIALGHAGDGACRYYIANLKEIMAVKVVKECGK